MGDEEEKKEEEKKEEEEENDSENESNEKKASDNEEVSGPSDAELAEMAKKRRKPRRKENLQWYKGKKRLSKRLADSCAAMDYRICFNFKKSI